MAPKTDLEQNLSILSALLYLRGELKMAGFENAEALVAYAGYAFFEDLKSQKMLEGDIARIKDILEYMDRINPEALKNALRWIETYEPQNDNTSSKTKNEN